MQEYDGMNQYAQHVAEEISQAQGNGATCTILGLSPLRFWLEDDDGVWIGTLPDAGQGLADIVWSTNDPIIAKIRGH